MDINSQKNLITILIYYNFRGQMQPIRNLFCYLGVPFFQIFNETNTHSSNQPPASIMAHFSKFKVDKQSLPALIHGNALIEGELPIMTYVCRCSNRNELLGWNIQTRVKLQEILEIYFSKQSKIIIQFLKLADSLTLQTNTQIVENQRCKKFLSMMNVSGYIQPVCAYLRKLQDGKYIFGSITVLDFLFFQTCFLFVNSFHKSRYLSQQINQKMKNCLATMAQFMLNFTNQPFYVKYRTYLQSFTFCSAFTSEQRKLGLKKFWLGDPKFMF